MNNDPLYLTQDLLSSIHSLLDHAHNLKNLVMKTLLNFCLQNSSALSMLSPDIQLCISCGCLFHLDASCLQPPHVGNWSPSSLDLPRMICVWFSHPGIAQMKTLGALLGPLPHISFKYLNPVDPIPQKANSVSLKYVHIPLFPLLQPYPKLLLPLTRTVQYYPNVCPNGYS